MSRRFRPVRARRARRHHRHADLCRRRPAADYPTRPIKLVVPFAAGGSTDIVARLVAEYAGRDLKQTIVVENKAGAGGSLGMEQVARSTPDGYTIGMATMSTHGSNPAVYRKMNYDPVKDFAPIGNAGRAQYLRGQSADPGQEHGRVRGAGQGLADKYSFASPGVGSLGHVNIENFMMLAGMKLLHVPYRGAGPALNDVMGGQVDAITDNLSSTLPQVAGGKLRALAVLGAQRSPCCRTCPPTSSWAIPTWARAAGSAWWRRPARRRP